MGIGLPSYGARTYYRLQFYVASFSKEEIIYPCVTVLFIFTRSPSNKIFNFRINTYVYFLGGNKLFLFFCL